MTHAEMVAVIRGRAQDRGLLSHCCRQPQSCLGPGFPDLIVAGRHGAA
jgi:hypothetical protein